MSQRRILGGITLLLLTLIVPPVQWFSTAMIRGDKFLKSHLPPDKALEYELKKQESQRTAAQIINPPNDTSSRERANQTPASEAVHETPKPADRPDAGESVETQMPVVEQPVVDAAVELNADIAPVVYEFKAATPTSREIIAKYVLGYDYRNMDEFSKLDFVSKLNAMIKERADAATPNSPLQGLGLSKSRRIQFDEQVFPIGDNQDKSNTGRYVSVQTKMVIRHRIQTTWFAFLIRNLQTSFPSALIKPGLSPVLFVNLGRRKSLM